MAAFLASTVLLASALAEARPLAHAQTPSSHRLFRPLSSFSRPPSSRLCPASLPNDALPAAHRRGDFVTGRQGLLPWWSRMRPSSSQISSSDLPLPSPPSSPSYPTHPSSSPSRNVRSRAGMSDGEAQADAPARGAAITEPGGMMDTAMEAARRAGALIRERIGADVIETKLNAMDLLTEVDGACQEIIEDIIKTRYPSHGFLGEESVAPGADASAIALEEAKANEWLWIVDPIDGTTNFASGMPLVGTIIALAHKGETVLSVIYDPFSDEMFHAVKGGGAFVNNKRITVSDASTLRESVIFTGSPPNPRSIRPTLRCVAELMPKARTIRMLGTAALMLAWVASGRAAAYFEPDLNAWDSAAGVLLIREAGGKVTDLEGNDWSLSTRPLCATNGRMHQELLDVAKSTNCLGMDEK